MSLSEQEDVYGRELVFYVNGVKVVEPSPDPLMTLLVYLRTRLNLTGTKLGCGEGGCGACTVMVSEWDATTKSLTNRAVNACLAPVCSVHGAAVVTVEGIGSVRNGLHPVQERIAKAHGSQCGFCTPGIVMSMYALLRNSPKPSAEQIEAAFDGNLCRCTGYRPILSGFKTFSCSGPGQDGACCGGGGCGGGNQIEEEEEEDAGNVPSALVRHDLFDPASFRPYDASQDPIFPPQLKLDPPSPTLYAEHEGVRWYAPTTVDDVLALKARFPEAKLGAGHSELAIEVKFKHARYPVWISTAHVPELRGLSEGAEGVTIGGAATLNATRSFLEDVVARRADSEVHNLTAMLENLQWFAGEQIRNVATLAGNIATASPISDMNPIMMASGARVTLRSHEGKGGGREMALADFFTRKYRTTELRHNEIITAIFVPYTRPLEYTMAFKQARRKDDDIAIANACLRVNLKHKDAKGDDAEKAGEAAAATNGEPPLSALVVESVAFAFGGMAATTVRAPKVEALLVGRTWDESLVTPACEALAEDLPVSWDAPGGQVEFRRSLAASFFFKFYLAVAARFGGGEAALPPRSASAIAAHHRPVSRACQSFEAPLVGKGDGVDMLGQPVPHLAASKQATGEALYTDDLPPYRDELYGALVMSKKARARIRSINAETALGMPGVAGYFDHRDVPGHNNIGAILLDEECFATDEVVCVGAVIGVVVADTQAHAQAAARAVVVEYEELEPVITIEQAIALNSFHCEPLTIRDGDTAACFAEADVVVEGEMRVGGQEHFYLETQACICVPAGEDGEMQVLSSTQNPSRTQLMVARVLGVPANRVTTSVRRMGGGFGGKESRSIFLAAALAVAAERTGRPVRCMLDRDEDMAITGGRHPFLARYRVAARADGKFIGAEIDLFSNGGYSTELSIPVMERALFHLDNCYKFPVMRVTGRVCKTNLATNTAFRGFGGPQGMTVTENFVADVARKCGVSQARVRELNMYNEGDKTHFRQELEACQARRCWDWLKQESDYSKRLAECDAYNVANRYRKRGLAMIPTKFGISFTFTPLNQAGALVHIYTDGSVLLTHGGTEMGQGLHTKMVQVCARALGVPAERVHISDTSTKTVPNTSPTAASASSDLNGAAILNACRQLTRRLNPLRSARPEASWEEIVTEAYMSRISLSAAGFYKTPDLAYNFETGEGGRPFNYFNYGAACAEVEVDTLTGDHEVRRVDICMDVGASINPAIDIGQVEGAFVQGQGMYTLEEKVYLHSGRDVTTGPGTYKIPGFKSIPVDLRTHLLRNAPNVRAVHSSKAVGEPPFFLGSSVFFAIKEAVTAARTERADNEPELASNVPFRMDSPATSARIRMACKDALTAPFQVPDDEPDPVRWNAVA